MEYKIEKALDEIDLKWQVLELNIQEHKRGIFKIVKTDEITGVNIFLLKFL